MTTQYLLSFQFLNVKNLVYSESIITGRKKLILTQRKNFGCDLKFHTGWHLETYCHTHDFGEIILEWSFHWTMHWSLNESIHFTTLGKSAASLGLQPTRGTILRKWAIRNVPTHVYIYQMRRGSIYIACNEWYIFVLRIQTNRHLLTKIPHKERYMSRLHLSVSRLLLLVASYV